MSWYSWFWLIWGLVGVGFEIVMLVLRVPGATLSENIWTIRDSQSGFFSLLVFFLLWMVYHFIFEGVMDGSITGVVDEVVEGGDGE